MSGRSRPARTAFDSLCWLIKYTAEDWSAFICQQRIQDSSTFCSEERRDNSPCSVVKHRCLLQLEQCPKMSIHVYKLAYNCIFSVIFLNVLDVYPVSTLTFSGLHQCNYTVWCPWESVTVFINLEPRNAIFVKV